MLSIFILLRCELANLHVPLDLLLRIVLRVQISLFRKLRRRALSEVQIVRGEVDALLLLGGEGDGVDVRPVHGAALPKILDGPDGSGAVDTSNLDAVAGPHSVHEVVEDDDRHILRRLAVGHELGRLLQLQDLAVRERALVVHDLERVVASATLASGWLLDGPMAQGHRNLVLAIIHRTPEDRREHVRNQVGAADHDALQGHQLLDVSRVHAAHDLAVLLQKTVHLDLAHAQLFRLRLELSHRHVPQLAVEDGDHFCGEIHHVSVELRRELVDVLSIDREFDALLPRSALLPTPEQLLDVIRLLSLCVIQLEPPNEAHEVVHNTHLVDVGAVQEVALLQASTAVATLIRITSRSHAMRGFRWRAHEAAVLRFGATTRGCLGTRGWRSCLRPACRRCIHRTANRRGRGRGPRGRRGAGARRACEQGRCRGSGRRRLRRGCSIPRARSGCSSCRQWRCRHRARSVRCS
mmetsp:Transcript_96824/g.312128  ORF Transcript_96824/g.312128 Transcript_96824/m.312128 type:complete len:466 (+) Transcript_96824:1606-3003(+)